MSDMRGIWTIPAARSAKSPPGGSTTVPVPVATDPFGRVVVTGSSDGANQVVQLPQQIALPATLYGAVNAGVVIDPEAITYLAMIRDQNAQIIALLSQLVSVAYQSAGLTETDAVAQAVAT